MCEFNRTVHILATSVSFDLVNEPLPLYTHRRGRSDNSAGRHCAPCGNAAAPLAMREGQFCGFRLRLCVALLVCALCCSCANLIKSASKGGRDTMIAESDLTRDWVHSQEEDSGNLMVFRPASHPFPP